MFWRLSALACHRALFPPEQPAEAEAAEAAGAAAGAAADHKAPLVRLADFEAKCRKWVLRRGRWQEGRVARQGCGLSRHTGIATRGDTGVLTCGCRVLPGDVSLLQLLA